MPNYQHQTKIIQEDPKKCGLFLGTGSGKTRIALLLARGKTLVICPKTQKEDQNWEREKDKLNLPIDLTTISKETFRRDSDLLPKYDTLIIDEAETCLGVTPNTRYIKRVAYPKTSQVFEALETFIKRTQPERIYLCTASITRSPMTVWGAGRVLGKNFDFYKWRDVFYIKLPMKGREVYAVRNDSSTKDRLAKVVQSLGHTGRLNDYFDVPEQTYKTIHIDLTEKQKKRIKELQMEYPDPIVLVGKILQVENGGLKGDEFNKAEVFENNKIEKLIDLSYEFPRMVVFAKYTMQIEQIEKEMKKIGKKVFILNGSTKNRGELLAEANKCDDAVFIAQCQVSSGWELPLYECMVFASMSYSATDRIQGEGRILRANHLKKNIYIDLIVKGGIDEAVQKCIKNKKDFDERIYVKGI